MDPPRVEAALPAASRFARELSVATAAANAAAVLIEQVYQREVAVHWKAPSDPVTEADEAANALLLLHLRREFPDDAICAEESPDATASQAASSGGRCWFVDPLDGTREFIAKSGEFCVMVGLAVAGRPVLGVIVAPIWKRTFCGVVGEGAWESTAGGPWQRLRVGAGRSAAEAQVVLSRLHRNADVEAVVARLGIRQSRQIRECGSTGLKFMLVAAGEVDLFVHTGAGPKLWDGCAPEAIALAAGAQVRDAQGRALRYDTGDLPLDRGLIVGAADWAAAAVPALAAGHVIRE